MQAQEKLSKSFGCSSDKSDPIFEPGTTVFIGEAAMGIIKVVSGSGTPSQVEDRIEVRTGTPTRKTCQVSLLSWELMRPRRGSLRRLNSSNFSSTE